MTELEWIQELVKKGEPFSVVLRNVEGFEVKPGYVIRCPWLVRGLFKEDEGGGMTRIRIEKWTDFDTVIGGVQDVAEALRQRKQYIASFGFYVWQQGRIMPTEDCWKIVFGIQADK